MNKNYFNWDVKTGDYLRDEEYDKLYLKNKKHEKLVRVLSWLGAASVVVAAYFFIFHSVIKI